MCVWCRQNMSLCICYLCISASLSLSLSLSIGILLLPYAYLLSFLQVFDVIYYIILIYFISKCLCKNVSVEPSILFHSIPNIFIASLPASPKFSPFLFFKFLAIISPQKEKKPLVFARIYSVYLFHQTSLFFSFVLSASYMYVYIQLDYTPTPQKKKTKRKEKKKNCSSC